MELRVPKNMIEFQLLKGVRGDEEILLVERGFTVKEYCAFGTEWQPYVVRRIQEFWRNVKWMVQDLFGSRR
jgi:proline dehydrogenase